MADRICTDTVRTDAAAANPLGFEGRLARGVLRAKQRRFEAAIVEFGRALAIKPGSAAAWSNLANSLQAVNRHDEALAAYDRALALAPGRPEAHNDRAALLDRLGRLEEALSGFDRAIALRGDYARAHGNRGNSLRKLGRNGEAVESFDRALAFDPGVADVHRLRGHVLKALMRPTEALDSYDGALALRPDDVGALIGRGNVQLTLHRYEDALASYEAALAVRPDDAECHNNRGAAFQALNRHEEALAAYERAIALRSSYKEAHNNRAGALQALGRNREALESYDRSLAIDPDFADARVNRALLSLLVGDFATGWPAFEARWQRASMTPDRRTFVQPEWTGREPVEGKAILLYSEQGFGDTLQFARYVELLRERGATVHLEVQPALKTLMADVPGVSKVRGRGEAMPAFDLRCALMSLPLAFGTTVDSIPSRVPYLRASPCMLPKWAGVAATGGLRVGLVWAGNPRHVNDRNRSMSVEQLDAILRVPGVHFFSLQKGGAPADVERLRGYPNTTDASDRLDDFADTAALIHHLDLVISVDTAVAHLAGAMGKPVWVLLPKVPDWRWLLDREDSPWYPTMRLFRQATAGDWMPAVRRMAKALQRLAGASPGPALRQGADAGCATVLGTAIELHKVGRLAEAEAIYQRALSDDPTDFDARHLLGAVLAQQGKHQQALGELGKALILRPDSPQAISNMGNVLLALGRHAEALGAYDRAVAAQPGFADAHSNRGNALRALGRFDEALSAYDRALKIEPGHADAHNNRGSALKAMNRHVEALASFDRALGLRPEYADAHSNRGNALKALGRYEDALTSYDRALRVRPDHVDARFNRSLLDLLMGEFARGWVDHEERWRRKDPAPDRRNFRQPLWLGREPLDGKTILIHGEQGYGDTLQFVRYAPLLAERGATVYLEVQPALKSLLRRSHGATEVFARGDVLPDTDFHCPLLSLPLALGTTKDSIPAQVPYVRAPQDKAAQWRAALGVGAPRVGVAWSGNPAHTNDANRSMPLAALAPILRIEGAQYVSLQKESRTGELRPSDDFASLLDVSSRLADFSDTAALIDNLDLVITVDTAVAHLAGAMGKPVWIMLPYVPDWRWLLERDDSPWYPCARLFRQRAIGEWDFVVDQVRLALTGWLATPSRPLSSQNPVASLRTSASTPV